MRNIFPLTTKIEDNRYLVKLPFKPFSKLGESFTQAKRRFEHLENRLNTKPELKRRYKDFIDEFTNMNHMEKLQKSQIEIHEYRCFYLPHHCVFKDDLTTTKSRMVFVGSAKSSNGVSLNDSLMIGPTVQDNRLAIIMRVRVYPIVIAADIANMYRQVALDESLRDYHRILLRDENTQKLNSSNDPCNVRSFIIAIPVHSLSF